MILVISRVNIKSYLKSRNIHNNDIDKFIHYFNYNKFLKIKIKVSLCWESNPPPQPPMSEMQPLGHTN